MGLGARKAVVGNARMRAAIDGPTKSGKSFVSLVVAKTVLDYFKESGLPVIGNGRIIVIDTEDSRVREQYADLFDFDHYDLYDFSPESYTDALKGAAEDNYSFTIIDQITHEWNGKNGVLQLKDNLEAAGKPGWLAWKQMTPRHDAFIDTIVRHPGHIICTMRAKMDYVVEQNDQGRNTMRRIGLEPIQRETTPYEFDIECSINQDHVMSVKTRGTLTRLIGDRIFRPGPDVDHPGDIVEFARLVATWLSGRADKEQEGAATKEQIKEIRELGENYGLDYQGWKTFCQAWKIPSLNHITPELYVKMKSDFTKRISKREAEKAKAKQTA